MDNQKATNARNVNIQTAKRKNRKSASKTVAIVTLSILLGLSLVFGVTAAFFAANANATGQITLGNPVNIEITQGGAKVTTLEFTGDAMPGTEYDQAIAVSVPADTSDAVLRGKLTITNTDGANVSVQATTNENWVKGDDDYYYYKGKASAGNSIDFVNRITVPKELTNADAKKTFALAIQIEAIQFANGAASEVWTTAPADWITSYGSGSLS